MAADVPGGHRVDGRRARWVVYVLVLVLNLVQQPGRITFDTKLDLQIDPGGFLTRSLDLWNPSSALGELQNQAYGYLFPLGPVYLAGHGLGVPVWIWERALSALLMIVAFEGMRRVALAWGGLNERGALIAGLFYMLSPRLVSTVGALTGEALPSAVLPWTVLPLVLCLRGRLPVLRAVLLSVATIPFMGGQNATEVIAALALPALLLLVNGHPWRTRARLFATWSLAAVVVCLWWLIPLVMLGRYGAPFLDYVESARNTTDQIGWLAALRGTDHWVTYISLGDSTSWRAGLELTSSRYLVVSTTVVATIGVLGLLSSRLPRRRALLLALVVGLFVLTAGSGPPAGSLLDGPWTSLLDGALAPFRNVHKFDPVVRAPLALGFAVAVEIVLNRLARHRWLDQSSDRPRRRLVGTVAAALLVLPVLIAGAPMARGQLRDSGGFTAIPDSWHQAVRYLQSQSGTVRSLVLPGSGFGVQTWGRTIDEPMQVLATAPWSARTQTPMMPAGTIRWLDQVETAVAAGRPDPTFAALLARAGITHVVVRNDLDYGNTDSPPPEVVHRLLDNAPGLVGVARFGSSQTTYPAVEVYAVDAGRGDDPRARLLDAEDVVSVVGASEAVDQVLAQGSLTANQSMVRATGAAVDHADVVTDTMPRVERAFGGLHDVVSQVMTAEDRYRATRAVHDYLYDPPSPSTVARYSGISDIVASSSRGYVDTLGGVRPDQGPYAAVDGSLLTSWVTSPFARARGSWIELRFPNPTVTGRVTLQFDLENGADVREVAVDTDAGRRTVRIDRSGQGQLPMETAPTGKLRITVLDAADSSRSVALEDIHLDDVPISRSLVVPGTVRADTTISLRSTPPRGACVPFNAGLSCRAAYQRLSVESGQWSRDVTVGESGRWEVSGTVVAAGGGDIAALMTPLDDRLVTVEASSWYGGDPATVPQNAFDGEATTTWVSATSDQRPVLDLRWKGKRTITRIVPRLLAGSPGQLPDRIKVESDDGTQTITLGRLGTGLLQPVRTTHLRLTMLRDSHRSTEAPVAVSELAIDGLEGRAYHADGRSRTGTLCGFGPDIDVGGFTVQTRVRGTIGDLLTGAPMELQPCGEDAGRVRLDPGRRRITVRNASGFVVRDLTLRPAGESGWATRSARSKVTRWGPVDRRIVVDTHGPAVLTVTQSLNPGWVATLHGTRLPPVEVDGWMQGWRVPAGSSGTVELRFAPQTPYLIGLIGGLLIALGAMLSAAFVGLRRRRSALPLLPDAGEAPAWSTRTVALLLLALTLVSLPAATGAVVGAAAGRWRVRRSLSALFVGGCFGAAVVVAVRGLDTSVTAPATANLLAAVAFGIMAGSIITPQTTDEQAVSGSDDVR